MQHSPVLLFDGECTLCHHSVQFIIKRDPKGIFRFASLQSNVGREMLAKVGLDSQSIDSFVYIQGNQYWLRSTAALKVTSNLRGYWKVLSILKFVPTSWRDKFYDWIARHRYQWFGKEEQCLLPTPELKERFLEK